MMLGFAFATVGMDGISGNMRLTFGFSELVKGISFLVAVIGLFGLGELMQTMEEGLRFDGIHARIRIRDVFKAVASMPSHWMTLLRSSLIGCWMGITPCGPTAASFMSYGLAKRFSRRKEHFGKGEPAGVVAPETADHSAGTCAILPMLALGVPGSATAAVMMGGLMIRADPRTDAVHRTPGFRLGHHRQHVPGQRHGRGSGSRHRADVRRHPAHPRSSAR